jgi:hypothetical protein
MDFSWFDRYHRYLVIAALLIVLLTYWRFRELNLSEAYSYVALQNVIHPMLQQSVAGVRSTIWDFFGLLNRIFAPNSVILLRLVGLCLTVLNYFLLSKILNDILGQRFWGFLSVFLIAMSPFMVVAAVSGVSAASAATITILFLAALYKNEYVFAGILAGVAMAANLPGLIMFLITILDLLLNSIRKRRIVQGILSSAAGFFGVVLIFCLYSMFSGAERLSPIPLGRQDVPWSLIGVTPIFIADIVNIAGIVYLIATKRYDIYRTHFYLLMMWITLTAISVAQPTTTNLLTALVISTLLATYFIQGFASIWKSRLVSVETFIFLFLSLFLFADLYANNKYLQGNLLTDCREKTKEVSEVVGSIISAGGDYQIVSNFASSELSVKLMKPVVEIQGEPFPLETVEASSAKTMYVVDKSSRVDSVFIGCRLLMSGSYEVNGRDHFVEVIECEGNNK